MVIDVQPVVGTGSVRSKTVAEGVDVGVDGEDDDSGRDGEGVGVDVDVDVVVQRADICAIGT